MAKFHVNTDTGNSGQCRATKEPCPFDPEETGQNHYDTPEEAREAAEKRMSEQHGEVYKGFRKGERAGGDLSVHMKRRIINEAAEGVPGADPAVIGRFLSQDKDENIRRNVAEKLNSQKLLRDMSDDESARVRKAVAQRTNNREVLAKLANDPDAKVRYAAIQNEKTPAKARKAAQAAIKEANLKNLEKARGDAKEAPKAKVADPGAPTILRETPISETKDQKVRRLNQVAQDVQKKMWKKFEQNGMSPENLAEYKELDRKYYEAQDEATRAEHDIPSSWESKENDGGGVSYRDTSHEGGLEITPNRPDDYYMDDGGRDGTGKLFVQTASGHHAGGPFRSFKEAEEVVSRAANKREDLDARIDGLAGANRLGERD